MLFTPIAFNPFYPAAAPTQECTWATKPPAAGNAGKEIIVTDYRRSRWYSDGTYWRPVSGRAVLRNWVGANVTFSSGSMAQISVVPTITIPADMIATPGLSVRNRVVWHRQSAAAAANQAGSLRIGADVNQRHLGWASITGLTAPMMFLLDETRTINTGLTTFSQVSNLSGQPALNETYWPQQLSLISGQPLMLSGNGVDTAGSDVWYMDQWLTEVIF